jgi:branched-chain amino acid transport system substrate-binding protein
MISKNKLIAIIVVVLIVVFGALAYNNNQNSNPESLKLGLMLPLTGDYGAAGQNMQKGMEIAIEQYKKENPETEIDVVIEDDAYNVTKGLSAYKKLTTIDDVDVILMLSTPVIDAIHEDVVEKGIPIIQLGIQTTGVADDNIIQFSPAADAPIGNFASYLNENEEFYSEKVAVVYDNSPGQLEFFKTFEERYTKEFTPLLSSGKTDHRSYANKIVNEDYGAVVFIMSPENGALLTKEILTIDQTPPMFAYDAQLQTGFADFERILGDTNKINGAKSLWFKSGKMEELTRLYNEKYGEDPGFLVDFSYDMINTALATYDENDSVWVENLKVFTDEDGASGPISFDENGIRIQPMVITEVQDGQLVPVQDLEV